MKWKMVDSGKNIKYLKRRIEASGWTKIFGFNFLYSLIFIFTAHKIGWHQMVVSSYGVILRHPFEEIGVFLLFNIPTFFVLLSVFINRAGYDDEALYLRLDGNAVLTMRFDDIDVVGFQSRMELPNNDGYVNTDAIFRFWRKNWDGNELFTLRYGQLVPKELKKLIQLVYKKCPGTFTEDMLRYVNSERLRPPIATSDGLKW